MRIIASFIMTLTVLATSAALLAARSSRVTSAPDEGVRALDGVWIYVEDRTEGRPADKHQPSMSSKVTFRVEDGAVVLVRSDGEIRMTLDGTPTEVARENSSSRYRGTWKDGAFEYESTPVRKPDDTRTGGTIRWTLRVTAEGLLASVETDSGWKSLALYRHPQDIPLPAPAKAEIGGMAWLAGAWVGTRGAEGAMSIEERWTPPLGGSMLAVSRTVSRGKLRAFEDLRILERDGGLVYLAQPNGRTATEFVLTELGENRAVFENPRHDSPQRIVYELTPDGGLHASIGYAKGGNPQRFVYGRENK